MNIKNYRISDNDILMWWFSLKPGDCSQRHNPLQIIEDLKTGKQDWYYRGIPLKLKNAGNI